MNRKPPQDQSPTYLQRQSQAWCKVHKERVRAIIKQERLCLDAKLVYMGLLTYLHDGGGVLIESKERVAKSLGFAKERLDYCLGKLDQGGWLEVSESGMIFEPVVYKYITGNEHPDDAESSRISQDLAKSGRILHSSPGETAPLDKIRASSLDAHHAASKERSDSISYQNQTGKENGEGSLEVASPFPSLKIDGENEVLSRYPNLNHEDVIKEYKKVNHEKGTPAWKLGRRKWFETFVVGYARRQGVATESAGPASKDPEAEAVQLAKLPKLELELRPIRGEDYCERVWSIGGKEITFKNFKIDQGDFLRLVTNMSTRPKAQAHKYLCSLVGCEWNTQHAFDYHDELLAVNDDNGDWLGANYESEEDKAERIERERVAKVEKEKAAEAARIKKEQEELARKQAEQIRKEREEAERKEREKAEAEKKQREAEERAKREAAEREEREKEEAAFNEKFASVLSLVSDECRERLSHDIQNESLWAKMKPDGAKDRFRIRIRLKVGDELTEKVITAIEANNLHWWNRADERKQLAEKHVNALLEKTVENGCTEGEAEAASAKVQELKAKYGIGLSKLVQKETDEAAIS